MLSYINNVFKVLSLVSIGDIRKIMNSRDSSILDIWGDYDTFISSQSSRFSDIRIALFNYSIYKNNLKKNKKYHNLYLVAKIGHIKLIRNIWHTFKKNMKTRRDLNLVTRIRLSLIKCKRIAHRDVFSLPILTYLENRDSANLLFINLFTKHCIDRIYLYKYDKNISKKS